VEHHGRKYDMSVVDTYLGQIFKTDIQGGMVDVPVCPMAC
jgi:hypothetical protein